ADRSATPRESLSRLHLRPRRDAREGGESAAASAQPPELRDRLNAHGRRLSGGWGREGARSEERAEQRLAPGGRAALPLTRTRCRATRTRCRAALPLTRTRSIGRESLNSFPVEKRRTNSSLEREAELARMAGGGGCVQHRLGHIQAWVAIEESYGLQPESYCRDRHDGPILRSNYVVGAERVP